MVDADALLTSRRTWLPARCRVDAQDARYGPVRCARAPPGARARVLGPGPRRLAGDASGPVHRGDARRVRFTVDDPALLDVTGRRAEHAVARRRRAQASSRPVRAGVPEARSEEPLRRPVEREARRLRRGAGTVRPCRDPARPGRTSGRRPSSTNALELLDAEPGVVLGWYDEIVAAVDRVSAGGEVGPRARDAVDALGRHVSGHDRAMARGVLAGATATLTRPRSSRTPR